MSARVREDGRVLCAAMHPAEDGDIYIDDGAHYLLAVELRLLVSEPMELPANVGRGGHGRHGEWWWRDRVPDDVVLEERPATTPEDRRWLWDKKSSLRVCSWCGAWEPEPGEREAHNRGCRNATPESLPTAPISAAVLTEEPTP